MSVMRLPVLFLNVNIILSGKFRLHDETSSKPFIVAICDAISSWGLVIALQTLVL